MHECRIFVGLHERDAGQQKETVGKIAERKMRDLIEKSFRCDRCCSDDPFPFKTVIFKEALPLVEH